MSRDADVASARELLLSSERLRDDLLAAAGKLESYIEQLKAEMPQTETNNGPSSVGLP